MIKLDLINWLLYYAVMTETVIMSTAKLMQLKKKKPGNKSFHTESLSDAVVAASLKFIQVVVAPHRGLGIHNNHVDLYRR